MRGARLPGRQWAVVLALAVAAGLLVSAGSTPDPGQAIRSEMPSLLPPGANMYLGFTDLRGDLQKLESSGIWSAFEYSDNHASFIRSRLWLRFQDRLRQMEMVTGAPLDGPGFSRLAASTCGLAFYEVGDIEFVYVGRADLESSLLDALTGMEGRFQDREHGEAAYRIARDPLLGMELAWSVEGGYIVLSDREQLLLETLDRIAGSGGPSLADDPGFHRVVAQLPADGDQMVYLNLSGLRDDGYFRSYWMQKDRTVLQQYEAYGATVSWGDGRAVEHRFLPLDVPGGGGTDEASSPADALAILPGDALVAKSVTAARPGEAAAAFIDGGRGTGEPVDSFRTPLHDLLESGDLTRDEFDLLVGDCFAVAVLARPYDDTFTLLDRVVVTRPTHPVTAEVVLRGVREALPAAVTGRLAGDVQRPFPMVKEEVLGHDVWTFDLYTRGIYAPSLAMVDGWLILGNSVEGVTAVIEARAQKRTLADGKSTRDRVRIDPAAGTMRQALYLDLDTSRETYETVIDAMQKGNTFRSWSAQEFWGERVIDLLHVLGPVQGITSWSSHTDEGLEGETVYRLEG